MNPITVLMQHFYAILRTQFHPKQQSAAEEVLDHFAQGVRYIQLSAQMQSGKTGCALYVAFDMLERGQVEKVFIISGSAETELRDQWIEKFPIHLAKFCHMRGITDEERVEQLGNIFEKGIIWRQHLLKNADKFDEKFLIIWDESHFATTQKQTLHKFYEEVGLMSCIQGDTSDLEEKNSYMISVTATRCAEQSKFVGATDGVAAQNWEMVVMNPGDNYRGVREIKAMGLMFPSVAIKEETIDQLSPVFAKYQGQRKYIVMRCDINKDQLVSGLAEKMGISVIRYNEATKKSGKVSVRNLKAKPDKLTLFLIRGMLRMGKELPKKHVCAVYECAAVSKTNTTLQGLLGRTCGYYNGAIADTKIDVYLPQGGDNQSVQEYIESVDSGFTKGITGTQHIPKADRKQREWFTNVPIHIPARLLCGQYSCFAESCSTLKKQIGIVSNTIQAILNGEEEFAGVFDKDNLTPEQIAEIGGVLSSSDDMLSDSIDIADSHFAKNGQLKVGTERHLAKINRAILDGSPVTSWKNGLDIKSYVKIIKFTGKSKLDQTCLGKGDVIIVLNTKTQSKFTPDNTDVGATNGKDIHHTHCEATTGGTGIDEDGVAKSWLTDVVRHTPSELKKAVRKLIQQSQDQSSAVRHTKTILTKKIKFDKEVYRSFENIRGIIQSVAKESFDGTVNIEVTPHYNPVDQGGAVRIGKISWN